MSAPRVNFPYGSGGGGGGGVSGTGTPGTIPIWSTTTALSDSPLSFATSTLTYSSAVTTQTFAATQTWTLPNNAFAFAVGGTGNATLKLDTNNRYVGIDSPSTPADKLHIAESGALAFRMQNVTAGTYWQHKVDASGNWGLAVNGGANAVTALAANGFVGIGTASPAGRLDVVGVAGLSWAIRAQVSSANTLPALNAELGLNLKNTSATVGNYTSITNRDSSDNANTQINFINVNNSGSGAINFVTRDSVGGSGERARIDSAGNVGIGTASPYTKAEITYGLTALVNGSSPNATTSLTLSGTDPGTVANGFGTLLQLRPITNRGVVVGIGALNGSSNKDSGGALAFYYNSGNGVIAEGARLDSAGFFGIGNVLPTARLHVGSSTTTTNAIARVQTQGGADQIPAVSLFRSGVSETVLWTPVTATGAVGFAINPAGYTDAQLTTATKVIMTVAGAVQATGSSATTPAFSTPTDTNTGMYFPSSDTLRFSTNGTPAVSITSSQALQFDSGYGSVATAYGTRAWVNFDGTAAGTFAGGASTVTRVAGSTTATVTTTSAHGLITGHTVVATSGVAAGSYTVTVINSTTFTITTAATTALTAVAITFQFALIRGSGNVNSVAKHSTGEYAVNFSTAMPDANYAINTTISHPAGSPTAPMIAAVNTARGVPTTTVFNVYTLNGSFSTTDATYCFATIVR